MMFFNPLFLQSISEAGAQTHAATNKLSNSKYLFSDIIKVFNESDPTAANMVLPESTSVSSAPEIFPFQSPDISNGVKYQDQKNVEGNFNQNILELISSILFANTTPVKPLQIENGLQQLPNTNSDGTLILSPGSKEFVVQSENLPKLLTQLISASQTIDAGSTKTMTAADSLPSEKNKFEVLISGLLKKLETDGEATIQLENAGQNIQFKISKIDETKKGKSETPAATAVQIPTTVSTIYVVNPTNNVTARADKHDQSGLKEVVKEIPDEAGIMVETGRQMISEKVVFNKSTTKLSSEKIKNIPTNPVVQSRNIDLELDKLISKAVETKVDANAEMFSIKTNTQLSNLKLQSSKIEVNSIKIELKPNNIGLPLDKMEADPDELEHHSFKEPVATLKKVHVSKEGIETNLSDAQINKVLNSQLNLNSECVINALEVESGNVTAPKNLNSYKIVMQVGEKEAKLSTAEKNVDVVAAKQSLTFSKPVSTDDEKNLTSNKPASSYSVKTILDSIKQVLKNESSANSINVFENKKTNDPTVQTKVEASDINLLNRLVQTNSKLISVSKSEADIKPAVDLSEKTFVKSSPTADTGKELSSQKSAGNADQNVINENRQPEPQVQNNPAKIDSKQETKVLNEALILNEPLIAKSKTEHDEKKNSPEIQKISSQNESDEPVVKTLLADKEAGADTHQHQPAQTELNDIKHDAIKTSPEVEETKTAEVQHNVSTTHYANEIKNSLPKEKISSNNFQLPETEKTIKSFELSKEISKIIESGTSQKVVLRLLPEALGKVKLTLEVGGEIIHAKAEVENESVRQIIQTNTETLRQTLSQNGLQLASFNVFLAGSDEKQQKAHGQKKRSNSFTSKSKIEKQALPEAARTLGYNTYEYLA